MIKIMWRVFFFNANVNSWNSIEYEIWTQVHITHIQSCTNMKFYLTTDKLMLTWILNRYIFLILIFLKISKKSIIFERITDKIKKNIHKQLKLKKFYHGTKLIFYEKKVFQPFQVVKCLLHVKIDTTEVWGEDKYLSANKARTGNCATFCAHQV